MEIIRIVKHLVLHGMSGRTTRIWRYSVKAYKLKTLKTGKKVYYISKTLASNLTEGQLRKEGYDGLPIGGIGNRTPEQVEEIFYQDTLRRLDRCQ